MIYPNAEDIEFVNMKKDSLLDDYAGNVYEGIGVKEVTANTEGQYYGKTYVVPWYVNGKKYDNGMYFQCDGGWGKIKSNFYPLSINVDCTPITAFSPTKIDIYEETQNYLKFASDLNEMLDFTNSVVKEGMIVYVTDIENAANYGFTGNDLSHYFVLENKDKSTTANGWHAVTQTELDNASTEYAERIIYLESIRESTEGNNSHTGEGHYDDGKSYVNKLNSIFGGAIENNGLTRFTQADIEKAISKYTFNIKTGYKDNKKCWYFGKGNGEWLGPEDESEGPDRDGMKYRDDVVNPEEGPKSDEPAANSIVNLKNIDIIFYYPFDEEGKTILPLKTDFEKYLLNVVMPYLEQVIPSTTIMTYDIMDKSGGTPSPTVANVTSMDSISTPEGYTILDVDGVIYTNEDYVNGMDMIDDDNIINR